MFDQYKSLFDVLENAGVEAGKGANTLTDLIEVQDKLRATASESAASQQALNEAFGEGKTNISQLTTIFGASLNPALESVAQKLGLSKDALVGFINSGKIGSDDVLPALAAAARENTSGLDTMSKATQYTYNEIQKLVETGIIAGTEVIPGMATALGKSSESISETDKALNNLSTSWDLFLKKVGEFLTADDRLADAWKNIKLSWSDFWESSSKGWDSVKADAINSFSEVGLGLSVLANDAKEGFRVIGETLGNTLAAIDTFNFKDLGDSLSEMLLSSGKRITEFTDKANEMNAQIQNGEDASKRTQEAMDGLGEAINNVPLAKLSDDLEELLNGINSTTEASDGVNRIWKELQKSDPFSGKDQGTLQLSLAIQAVQRNTGDAQGTLEAFGKKLSELPADQLMVLLSASGKLDEQLKKVGDSGHVSQVILSAAFQKLNMDSGSVIDGFSKVGKEAIQSFAIVASSAKTSSEQVRTALDKAIASASTEKDLEFLIETFKTFGNSGKLSAGEVAEGMEKINKALDDSLKKSSDSQLSKMLSDLETQMKSGGITAEQYTTITALLGEQQRRLNTSSIDLAKSELRLAEEQESTAKAREKNIELYGTEKEKIEAKIASIDKQEASQAAYIKLLKEENQEAQRQLASDISLSGGIDKVSTSKRQEFEARQKTIDAKNEEIKQAQVVGEGMIRERSNLDGLISNSITYLNAIQKIIDADTQRLQTQGTLIDSNIKRMEAEKRLAEAQGDLATAASKQKEIDSEQIRQAENTVAIEQLRLSSLQNRYRITLSQALADGQLTEAEQQVVASLEQEIAAQQGAARAAEDSADAVRADADAKKKAAEAGDENAKSNKNQSRTYEAMESAVGKSVRQLHELSAGAGRMVDTALGIHNNIDKATLSFGEMSDEAKKLANHLEMTNAAIAHNKSLVSATTGVWGDVYLKWANAANAAWKAFDEQALAAEMTITRLTEATKTGAFSMDELNMGTVSVLNSTDLLDAQRLDRLNAAIESANQKLREMQQEAEDARQTLAELNEETLREQGKTDEADRLSLETEKAQKLAEVEDNLNKARLENNRELIDLYEEQKQKLQELYGLKNKNLDADIKQREEEEKNTKETNSSSTKTKTKSSGSGSTHTLQFKAPDGTGVNIPSEIDEGMMNQLLDILKKSGLRMGG